MASTRLERLLDKLLDLLVQVLGSDEVVDLGAILICNSSRNSSKTPFIGQLVMVIGANPGHVHGRVFGTDSNILGLLSSNERVETR